MDLYKIIESNRKKTNHLTMVVNFESEEAMNHLLKEIKKTIHKENRLLGSGFSYEIYCDIGSSRNL